MKNPRVHYFFLFLLLLSSTGRSQSASLSSPALMLSVPDGGWRLWPDTTAPWQADQVYLPGEKALSSLPENEPSGGWKVLSAAQGVPVVLPSTVEQHFWGKFGFRPYQNEYLYEGEDHQVQNGNYKGVSWWWTPVIVPASFAGKTTILHIRGARQRAEVYLNQTLVGYSLVSETGFDCDVSRAVRPGQVNQLAIRITNPGGRIDWGDWDTYQWGKTSLFLSHGFGGLDRAITLSAHSPVYLTEAWVLNTPQPRTIQAHAVLRNGTGQSVSGTLRLSILNPTTNAVLAVKLVPASLAAGSDLPLETTLTCPTARLWGVNSPSLYRLRCDWVGAKATDSRDVTFGFRWFAPEGIGTNALLRLNGQRIRIYSAISWGFWGLNGLWPTPALALKEVTQAKKLGLNCLNFHRNIGRAEVLDAQDRLGLLRYMEPGGGQFAIGPHAPTDSGEAITSGEKYMEQKILGMIRDARSHPSLVMYVVQNEADFDLKNPRVFFLLRRMHREDPSRTIVLKSGISTKGEAWMKPFDDAVYSDQGDGYSGWSDAHTVGYPDAVWQDDDYKNPDDFAYRSTNMKEIVDWGEMGGSGVLDNHALMVSQIKAAGGKSYDLRDHQELLDTYNAFLDKWGFRAAFPTAGALFHSIGSKQYDYWGNLAENARLSDANDYVTMSGWETTAIEDHSGLVDNLRNFHGDPSVIHERLAPVLPVAKLRHSVLRAGDAATLDLYLLNETNRPVSGLLKLSLTDPAGRTRLLGNYPAPVFLKDQFVYPVKAGVVTPSLLQEGVYHLTFAFANPAGAKQVRELRVVGVRRLPNLQIGVLGSALEKEISALSGVRAEPYRAEGKYDALAIAGGLQGSRYVTADTVQKTQDPQLYQAQRFGQSTDTNFVLAGLKPGSVSVTLLFAETYQTQPARRKFDVVINGRQVLHDFDIFAEAGGKNIALQKTFTVDAPQGIVEVKAGTVAADNATFAAIKAEDGKKVIAVYFGDTAYTDKSGQLWQPYQTPDLLSDAVLARVRLGMPLLIDTQDDHIADQEAQQLAAAGAFQYAGLVGRSRAPWMGCWYFVRQHPVYDGLPVNEAMKSDYQVGTSGANGLRVDGKGVEIITGFGRDHDRNLGAATFTVPLGRGTVLFQCMPPMHPAMRQRWLANALAFLAAKKALL